MIFNICLLGYNFKQSAIIGLSGDCFKLCIKNDDLLAKVCKTTSKTHVQRHFLSLFSSAQWKMRLFRAVNSSGFLSARPIKT